MYSVTSKGGDSDKAGISRRSSAIGFNSKKPSANVLKKLKESHFQKNNRAMSHGYIDLESGREKDRLSTILSAHYNDTDSEPTKMFLEAN
jgi:hypothetical protein|eukprot:scaffold168_cov220-Chaetoceros_neogracile.AAC.10